MERKQKLLYFIFVFVFTILISRIMVSLWDPNFFVGGFEMHHFYLGLVSLIVLSLLMLFREKVSKTYLILSAVAIGLILDELFFIMGKVRGGISYGSSLPGLIFVGVLVLLGVYLLSWRDMK